MTADAFFRTYYVGTYRDLDDRRVIRWYAEVDYLYNAALPRFDMLTLFSVTNMPSGQAATAAVASHLADVSIDSDVQVTQITPRPATNDERIEAARRVLRKDYWDDVRSIADDFKRAIADGEITDTDDAETWLHETIDGCQRVIYTAQAIEGLLYTDNESAFVDEFGEEGLVRDGDVNWSGLMYSALLADVRAQLGDVDELIADAKTYCADCDEDISDAEGNVTATDPPLYAGADPLEITLCADCAAERNANDDE